MYQPIITQIQHEVFPDVNLGRDAVSGVVRHRVLFDSECGDPQVTVGRVQSHLWC